MLPPPRSALFPYTTLSRSERVGVRGAHSQHAPLTRAAARPLPEGEADPVSINALTSNRRPSRSQEHTAKLQPPRQSVSPSLLARSTYAPSPSGRGSG